MRETEAAHFSSIWPPAAPSTCFEFTSRMQHFSPFAQVLSKERLHPDHNLFSRECRIWIPKHTMPFCITVIVINIKYSPTAQSSIKSNHTNKYYQLKCHKKNVFFFNIEKSKLKQLCLRTIACNPFAVKFFTS